jgi:hypothetical protein
MAELSPAAQAIMVAATNGNFNVVNDPVYKQCIAAALRAAAELNEVKPEVLGPCDETYGDYMRIESISQRDYIYNLAKANKKVKIAAYDKLLAIAAELEGSN